MPMLDELKAKMKLALKDRDAVAKNILSLAVAEMQTAEARNAGPISDEEAIAIVRKLLKSNDETLALETDQERVEVLRKESAILHGVLPKTLSVDEIRAALESQVEAIRAAKNDGQATGLAVKHLKATGASMTGTDVAAAVKAIRS